MWAGSSGTPSCGASLTPGTLTAANYTQSFSYDTLGRLTSGPLGSYTYGDAVHLHAATAIGSGGSTWTGAYDTAGHLTCRAPSGSTTCAGGSPTGAQLSYDNEGWLTAWQDAPSNPTSTAQYLYDGDGQRVAQQVTTSSTTTTTYIGNVEEVATSGATTTTTTYYYAGDERVALAVNGTFSYLGDDLLGSASVALDPSGAPVASQLYSPYGTPRYSNGVMPGSFGFTGQRSDATTGLDYYSFRYYDPIAGQFVSADSAQALNGYDILGLSRYAYVKGNPETLTDPDGHCFPLCTMAAGAAIGALIGGVTSVATQVASGKPIDPGQVAKEMAVGAVSGAISGLVGPAGGAIATIATHAIVGAAAGAAGQVVSNALDHKPLGDGVLMAAGVGLLTGGLEGGVTSAIAARAARLAPRLAGARGLELAGLLKGYEKGVGTAVAAHLQDGRGVIRKFVTLNESGWRNKGIYTKITGALKRGEHWLEPWATPSGKTHGEVYLDTFARQKGWKIVGIGPSNFFCGECERMLVPRWGRQVLGNKVSPKTGSGYVPPWMR